jgi:hypothetical protein
MEDAKGTVQVVFLGHYGQLERAKFLLRRFIPHKVYFLRSSEPFDFGAGEDFRDDMEKELKKELPRWVADASEDISLPFFSFERLFPALVRIMAEEKSKGNEVIVNSHGSSMPAAFAAMMAAALTGAKHYWAEPDHWEIRKAGDRMNAWPVGAKRAVEIKVPLMPEMPKSPDRDVLAFVFSKGGTVKGKLADMSEEIGFKKLGANVKKPGSGIVKLSKIVKRLREGGHIATRKIGRKSFEVALTEKGKMVAEVVSLL